MLIWELVQESACLILSYSKLAVIRCYKQMLDFHLAPDWLSFFILNWKRLFTLKLNRVFLKKKSVTYIVLLKYKYITFNVN